MIDTFDDRRRILDFFCNPLGIQGDMIEYPDCEGDSRDVIWDSAGKIHGNGYTVSAGAARGRATR